MTHPAVDAPPAPAGVPKSLRVPATVAITALAIVIGAYVLGFLLRLGSSELLARALAQPPGSRERSGQLALALLTGIVDLLLTAGAFLFAAIAVICWLHRASSNLSALAPARPDWGPGWTIGGWLIPIANLFIRSPSSPRSTGRASPAPRPSVSPRRPATARSSSGCGPGPGRPSSSSTVSTPRSASPWPAAPPVRSARCSR